MDVWPDLAALAGVDRARICVLLDEYGTPAWTADDYEHEWQRERATWRGVGRALHRATVRSRRGVPAAATPPRWLAALVRRTWVASSSSFHAGPGFDRSRLLERLGLVSLDHDETWVLSAISGLGASHAEVGLDHLLREDGDLREELVWRLFEVEGGGEVSLANVDRFGGDRWRGAFLALTDDGTLPRDRVLDGCLTALARDFNHYRAGWFTGTWLALEPDRAEQASRQAALLPLLRAGAAPVVSFALKQLQAAHRGGGLDPLTTVAALLPATQARAKGTALGALRLAASLAAGEPGADARPHARSALGHEHPDVQAVAVALLADLGEDDAVTAAAPDLAPRVRDALGLEPVGGDPGLGSSSSLAPPVTPTDPADLVEVAAGLLEEAGDASAVEGLLAALVSPDALSLAPVLGRARAVLRRHADRERGSALGLTGLRASVARLVLAQAAEPAPSLAFTTPTLHHLGGRFAEVESVLRGHRPPLPLLATPDLPGGLVSSDALGRRLVGRDSAPAEDLTAALLRLETGTADLGAMPAWVRRRAARLPGPLDGPARHATLATTPRTFEWTDADGRRRTGRYLSWELTAPAPPDGAAAVQAVVPHGVLGDWWGLVGLVCPRDAEHLAALGHHVALSAAVHDEIYHDAPRVLDRLGGHAGRLGPLAHTVLAAGLGASRGDHRVHASDAYGELIGRRQVEPVALAAGIVLLSSAVPLSRYADSLRRIAASGGSDDVVTLLTETLPGLDREQVGLHALLELLLDESIRLGRRPVDARLRRWLAAWSGGSRATRAARRLLDR